MKQDQSRGKKLRSGFTTGSCAAAAAKAGTFMLLTGDIPARITIHTPQGVELQFPVLNAELKNNRAFCAVKKDSGDDPDITNGILIWAEVALTDRDGISVDGGLGIGKVTRPGLACAPGEAAINPVPRKMIEEETQKICRDYLYQGGLNIIISAPEAEKVASKTFNARLGILGGISILGTSGIVEPMSERAWIDTVTLEMKQQMAMGNRDILICPGNYGQDFIVNMLGINIQRAVKCSNFIGETLDFAAESGFESLLLIGHIGKLVKLAAGIMNTHSKYADARMEILTAHAALHGADSDLLHKLMACSTTEEAVLNLTEKGLSQAVFQSLMLKIDDHVKKRVQQKLKTAVIIFSNEAGILGKTEYADQLLEKHRNMGR